ncbi:MAG: DUF1816 domain-containing protein [Chloroflexaceae bacterium]|nr:DUF1816 domain-containing protein [Chloroflexaceae bacterium]
MKEQLTAILDALGLAFWIEILTEQPRCTYFFGPFLTRGEAEASQSGYLEDLEVEGATEIRVNIKRCKPENLTIFDEEADRRSPLGRFTSLSGQTL